MTFHWIFLMGLLLIFAVACGDGESAGLQEESQPAGARGEVMATPTVQTAVPAAEPTNVPVAVSTAEPTATVAPPPTSTMYPPHPPPPPPSAIRAVTVDPAALYPKSPEQMLLRSDLVVRASLDSATATTEAMRVDGATTYRPIHKLAFTVHEYLKGSGPDAVVVTYGPARCSLGTLNPSHGTRLPQMRSRKRSGC